MTTPLEKELRRALKIKGADYVVTISPLGLKLTLNPMLGCVQIALDPEAIGISPAVYLPEVLELARQLINTSVQRLEYEEIRRLLHGSAGCPN